MFSEQQYEDWGKFIGWAVVPGYIFLNMYACNRTLKTIYSTRGWRLQNKRPTHSTHKKYRIKR